MFPRLNQMRKILTSGVLFACLGVGGLLCTLILPPVFAILPGGAARRRLRAEKAVRLFFRLFIFSLSKSGILRVEADGLPDPRHLAGAIVLANHPSYLDIVLIIALLPGAICVVKEDVWNNPFFGRVVRAAGFIPSQGSGDLLELGRAALAAGKTLVIFPEGTRTAPGEAIKFHRGAAHMALRTGAPVFPFVMTVTPPLLAKGHRWYQIPVSTCVFRVSCAGSLPPDTAAETYSLKARDFTHALERHYAKELHGPIGLAG